MVEGLPQDHRWWVGSTDVGETEYPGSAGPVHALIFRAGTLPDYNAPQITPDLIDQVMVAFAAAADSTLLATSEDDLRAFLQRHLGRFVVLHG